MAWKEQSRLLTSTRIVKDKIMADIELVIDIPEETYIYLRNGGTIGASLMIENAIKNGTPLPKGHGDLKDISKIDYQPGCFVSSEGEPIPIIHKIATIEMIRDWLPTIIEADRESENAKPQGSEDDKGKLSWLGKNCKDCGNEKCKKLGTLPKGHDCALWQPKVENHFIKTVTNAKEAENYPISDDISKNIEEINKLLFENGQAESEDKSESEN